VQRYAERLVHYTRFSLVELPESKKRTPDEARRDEGERLLALKGPGEDVVALDERGKALDSRELAQLVGSAQNGSRDLLFAIGGDEGLDDTVRKGARLVFSLSRLTLPHRLARLVLIEQLYRAFTLLKGEPYHK
jgi:23S rRNA (pseudouridine1915-N3)-methyltransferase